MDQLSQVRPFLFSNVLTLCLLFAFPAEIPAQHNARPSPSPSVETGPPPSVISGSAVEKSLPEIVTGADELKRLHQEVAERVSKDSERAALARTVDSLGPELESRAQQLGAVLSSSPSLPELQDLHTEWLSLSNRLARLRNLLIADAAVLNKDLDWLNLQQAKWTTTLAQLQADPSLEELRVRISQSLADIESTKTLAEDHLKLNITLQTRISERNQFLDRVIAQISNEKTLVQRDLFQADTSPLWHRTATRESDQGVQRVLHRSYARDWNRSREFVSSKRNQLRFAGLVFLLVLVGAFKMKRLLPEWTKEDIVDTRFTHVFKRPISLAVFATGIATIPLLPVSPAAFRGLISVLLAAPTLRLIGPNTLAPGHPLLSTVLIATILVQLIKLVSASPSLKRNLLALSMLALACIVVWLWRRIRAAIRPRHHNLALLVTLYVLLVSASLVANVLGYFALSQVLADVCLIGTYYGVVLYTAKEVALTVISTLLKTGSARRVGALRGNTTVVMHWLRVLFALAMWITLFISILRLFTVRDAVFETVTSWLNAPLVAGASSFTAGDVLTFLIVVATGFITATVLRVVLREDVLRRLPVDHGVPFAVSTITYYILLVFIFILALLAAGVELSKFTLFTGAFGIGVGFGLQNAINNFASGLILLFERPIRKDDILEVDGAFGQVTRIGMRSTSIRTAEEAEVIVPNSNLVAGKVVNWSRLGRRRPVELPVRVAYGCKAIDMIELLEQTAARNSSVLGEPGPKAYLQGFGEKGMEFCLVFWVAQYHVYRTVLSDVAVSVAEELVKNKIEVPAGK